MNVLQRSGGEGDRLVCSTASGPVLLDMLKNTPPNAGASDYRSRRGAPTPQVSGCRRRSSQNATATGGVGEADAWIIDAVGSETSGEQRSPIGLKAPAVVQL